MPIKPVRKAVIAAAGFGTRFLPQTKAMPKEMLPLVDKPIIQYIVEELVEAGIEDIVIVTGYHKRAIEDHFDDMSSDLRKNLKDGNKLELLEATRKVSNLANFAYIRQKGPYGNATPILNAAHLIGDEPFIYTFADDFVKASPTRFKQLVQAYQANPGVIMTGLPADKDADFKRYGYIGGTEAEPGVVKVEQVVEKPGTRQASPSSLASVSGYILPPEIFNYLQPELDSLPAGEEFLSTSVIQRMIDDGKSVHACVIQNGKFYDTGNKLEYLKTVVDFALEHDDLKKEFAEFLATKVDSV
ncbi:MAG: sugar phosphate nucleotidyltransferase [Candidatus Saccharimonadales bacterium]